MSTENKINLLVADEQEIVRNGIKAFLDGTEIKVTAEAATGQAVLKLALSKQFDVVLLGMRMPGEDGMSILSQLKKEKPKLPVVMYSAIHNRATLRKAEALGVNGFLSKSCKREDLLNTIRAAAKGDAASINGTIMKIRQALNSRQSADRSEVSITSRETEVLKQIVLGSTNKQIASELTISIETVKEHVQNLFRKLGVSHRTQAAVWAIRNNLV